MKTLYSLLFIALSGSLFAQDISISPIQTGAYIPEIGGVRDYAFPNDDGLIIVDYNVFINSDTYYDKNGKKANSLNLTPYLDSPLEVPLKVDISGYINSLTLTYASPKLSILGGGQYMFILAPNYTTANAAVGLGELTNGEIIKGGASGFGDLTVAPLMLSWGFESIDFTAGYLFTAPTGKYEDGADDNIGLGYWSHMIQAASYLYPVADKSTAIMVMPSYEFHGKLKNADVKPGGRFILEYGISQYFSERFEVTLQGGHAWQIGEDTGKDVYWDASVKDQMSIYGVGVGYWVVPDVFYFNAKYSDTYANKQHFDVNSFAVELLIIPNWLKKKVKE